MKTSSGKTPPESTPDAEEYRADVIAIEREIVRQLAEAGCPYIQHDAPGYTAYVDGPSLEQMRQGRGEDPDAFNLARSIAADNALIDGFSGRDVRHPPVPGQSGGACGTARAPTTLSPRRLFGSLKAPAAPAGVRHGARRQLRAAAIRAPADDGRARPGGHQKPRVGNRRRAEAENR